jgi:hypothetical protein
MSGPNSSPKSSTNLLMFPASALRQRPKAHQFKYNIYTQISAVTSYVYKFLVSATDVLCPSIQKPKKPPNKLQYTSKIYLPRGYVWSKSPTKTIMATTHVLSSAPRHQPEIKRICEIKCNVWFQNCAFIFLCVRKSQPTILCLRLGFSSPDTMKSPNDPRYIYSKCCQSTSMCTNTYHDI